MKTGLYLLLYFFLLLSIACQGISQQNETIYQTCPKPTQCEYNPQEAGAEIIQRIDAPKGLFISKTNNHYYMFDIGKITVFDISNDSLNILSNIPYNLKEFYPYCDNEFYASFLKGFGIFEINDKIVFAIRTDDIYFIMHI